jgi:putative molybdopterin biosynthesis protein
LKTPNLQRYTFAMSKKAPLRIALDVQATLHIGEHALDLREMQQLLRAVADARTLNLAADAARTTYRTLWGRLERYAAALGQPVVDKSPGQGTQLTGFGRALLAGLEAQAAHLRVADDQLAETLCAGIQAAIGGAATSLRLHASHDFAIARALSQQADPPIEMRYVGGAHAAKALLAGEADLAGFHLPAGAGAVWESVFQNVRDHPQCWMQPLMEREQGIMIAKGNPRAIFSLTDLAKPGVRFINRQRGSGTRILLDQLLRESALSGAEIAGYETEEFTHQAVAAMVSAGAADAGLGLLAAAKQFNLDFIPLGREIYYLAGRDEIKTLGAVRAFVEKIKVNAAALEGYSVL